MNMTRAFPLRPKTKQSIIIIWYMHKYRGLDLSDKPSVYTPGIPITSRTDTIHLGSMYMAYTVLNAMHRPDHCEKSY